MHRIWILSLLFILHTVAAANVTTGIDFADLLGISPRRDRPFHELVKYDGYKCENHIVTTNDGYILGVFRIPPKLSCSPDQDKLPLIFMHGLYLSSDDCIIPGPGKAHCYTYADACYDVWVPNIRGNTYSRKHVSLNPDIDRQFWNFTFDEMALLDLPAVIDYILEHTGKKQVTYIGHSQGVAICILLCAKKPEYNAKIKMGFALSPAAHLQNARLIVLPFQALTADLTSSDFSHFEIFAYGKFTQILVRLLCGVTSLEYPLCSGLVFILFGYNKFQITPSTLMVAVGHEPRGTSFKNFARWGQMKKHGFCEMDYGSDKNLVKYGQVTPPLFDLSAVTMPWYIFASENDVVGDLKDIAKLQSQMPNVTLCVLSDKWFGHVDFIYGKDIVNYLTPSILSVLSGGPFICK